MTEVSEAPAAWRIVGLVVAVHGTALEVAVGADVHGVLVTWGGACRVPCGLALHPMRGDIEAECQQVAAQARLGRAA